VLRALKTGPFGAAGAASVADVSAVGFGDDSAVGDSGVGELGDGVIDSLAGSLALVTPTKLDGIVRPSVLRALKTGPFGAAGAASVADVSAVGFGDDSAVGELGAAVADAFVLVLT